jgi:hypothetical protein
MLDMPFLVALKAEALHLADRTSDALEAITEVEALIESLENRYWCAELHRLRGVFLTAIGGEETQIEASSAAAISTAKQQKSTSLATRAEATYAEYRRQKASASGGRGFQLLFVDAKREIPKSQNQFSVALRITPHSAEHF